MAVRSLDSEIDSDVDILLMGDHGVGKTELLQKFASGASFSNPPMLTSSKFCNYIYNKAYNRNGPIIFYGQRVAKKKAETHVDIFRTFLYAYIYVCSSFLINTPKSFLTIIVIILASTGCGSVYYSNLESADTLVLVHNTD